MKRLIGGGLASAVLLLSAACGSSSSGTHGQPDKAAGTKSCATISPNPPASGQLTVPPVAAIPTKLVTKDVTIGTGPAATAGASLSVDYIGVSCANGKVFDATYKDGGAPFTVSPLGTASVIPGWNQGLIGIKAGGVRELIIPPSLGYGAQGSPPVIPPNDTLIFLVTAKSVKNAGATPAAVHAKGCTTPPALQKKHLTFSHEPPITIAKTNYTATIVTNCGTITATLFGAKAPHTVNSFDFLAGKGYFTDTPCHRLTLSAQTGIAVLQCGDPTGSGSGGPGYTIPDENLKGATYPPGTLAMANTGQPHTGGSQFFFVYGPTQLTANYTPFGIITSGLQVLKNIAAAGTNNSNGQGDGGPNQPVVIEKFTVTKG